jgi:DNA-binding response OmpR family regulator
VVVTPDAALRKVATDVLETAGYRVYVAAHTGHALLACIAAGRVDVLAAEVSMDDLSGPQLAERLRRFSPDLTAVFFASAGSSDSPRILVRPFAAEDLLAAIATARAEADAWQLATSAS